MKRIVIPVILIGLIVLELVYMDDIKKVATDIINNRPSLIIEPSNEYTKNYDFLFVERNDKYIPFSIKDIRNIYFSIINNGWDEFTYYCPTEYEDCVKDIQTISADDTLLTDLNNYASPFNSFTSIETTYDDSGEINVKLKKLYSEDQINIINNVVDKIIKENIRDDMSDEQKVRVIHDYIINHTEYDKVRNDTGDSKYQSNTAYGTLIENQAICSGYADAMELFLNKFNIKNYKIASKSHVWNAVYINNKWLHLDLTWDDPVSDRGPILDHKYFLITNSELESIDDDTIDSHIFDKKVYLEFNY